MKDKLKKVSIKWRLFIYFLIFSGIMLFVLWLFQIIFLNDFYKIVRKKEIKEIAQVAESYVAKGDFDALKEAVNQRKDISIELCDEKLHPVVLVDHKIDMKMSEITLFEKEKLYQMIKEQDTSVIDEYSLEGKAPWGSKHAPVSIIYANLVKDNEGDSYLLLVNGQISPMDATISTLQSQFNYIALIFIVLSVFLAFFISKRMSKPMVNINQMAAKLGQGVYDQDFVQEDYLEIYELSNTLSRAAKELQKTEQLREEFIANISHDLRTPLTLITGYSEMMRDIPGENTQSNMQVIIEESKRLTELVNELMELSKINSGNLPIEIKEMNLTKEIQMIIERVKAFSQQNDYRVDFEYETEQLVMGDCSGLSRVIYNLILNAIFYTGADKTVKVVQEIKTDRVIVQVIDTGKGIAKDDLAHVWDRYYRSRDFKEKSVPGTGLGLAIVKSILDLHPHIEYGVESEENKGSCFWLSIKI